MPAPAEPAESGSESANDPTVEKAITSISGFLYSFFIVYIIKLVKAEKERRKAIRLKLNEDVEDDGTN